MTALTRWREQAACRDTDPELFFPAAESGPSRAEQVAAAKAVCAGCPVRAECLEEALTRIPYGIAGGLTEYERRQLRAGQPAKRQQGRQRDGLSVQARDVLSGGPRPAIGQHERAEVGLELLADGHRARQVASACRVSVRTAERWATATRAITTNTRNGRSSEGAGEGSTAATAPPSGSPQHTTTPGRDTSTGRTRA